MTNTYLATALILWRRGEPIPVDLWMKLAEMGHDVPHLEAKYRT